MTWRVMFMTWMCAAAASVIVADEPPRAELPPASNPAQQQVQLQIKLVEQRCADSPEKSSTTQTRVLAREEVKPFLEKLKEKPETKILAAPTLRLVVGQEGSFRSGGEFLREVPSSNGNPSIRERVFFGTAVDATVTMPKPGLLSINLNFEQSNPTRSDKTGVPGLNKHTVQTRVELQSGQTAILQGLRSTRDVNTETRVPLLGDIPVIGDGLFAKRRQEKETVEMIVLITAELIDETTK